MANEFAKMSPSDKFTALVEREIKGNKPDFPITDAQRQKVKGYFIAMDNAQRMAEASRKSGEAISWNSIVLDNKLAQDLYVCSQIGFDMALPNMLFPVLRWDSKAKKYRFTIQKGYMGKVFEAMKYAVGHILSVSAELVYSTDKFIPHFKDANHPVETYELEITNPFGRGEIVGGFAYIEYEEKAQNKLVIMSKEQIDKRRKVAKSQMFWGNWYEEMAKKTVYIAACKAIPLDPLKLDAVYRQSQAMEESTGDVEAGNKLVENQAEGEVVDVQQLPEAQPVMEAPTMAAISQPEPVSAKQAEAEPDWMEP